MEASNPGENQPKNDWFGHVEPNGNTATDRMEFLPGFTGGYGKKLCVGGHIVV